MLLEWDERGIVFPAAETLPPRTVTVSTAGRTIHRVPWEQVQAIEPVDPWPALRLAWDGASEVLCPAERADEPDFARRVAALLVEAERRAPEAASPGWLSAPELDWERVKYMPGEGPSPRDQGAYRSQEMESSLVVVAQRPPLTVVRAFFDWLVSTPAFPFREQPLQIALTDEELYARFRGDWVGRLPRATLRARIPMRRAGTLYVFGRGARLLLPAGPANEPIARELDEQLKHLASR